MSTEPIDPTKPVPGSRTSLFANALARSNAQRSTVPFQRDVIPGMDVVTLPDNHGEVRIFHPSLDDDDVHEMFVLNVHGVAVDVHVGRDGELRTYVDREGSNRAIAVGYSMSEPSFIPGEDEIWREELLGLMATEAGEEDPSLWPEDLEVRVWEANPRAVELARLIEEWPVADHDSYNGHDIVWVKVEQWEQAHPLLANVLATAAKSNALELG